jgi:hypothetical protein
LELSFRKVRNSQKAIDSGGEKGAIRNERMQTIAAELTSFGHPSLSKPFPNVRVAAPEGHAGFWLSRLLPGFYRAKPGISID